MSSSRDSPPTLIIISSSREYFSSSKAIIPFPSVSVSKSSIIISPSSPVIQSGIYVISFLGTSSSSWSSIGVKEFATVLCISSYSASNIVTNPSNLATRRSGTSIRSCSMPSRRCTPRKRRNNSSMTWSIWSTPNSFNWFAKSIRNSSITISIEIKWKNSSKRKACVSSCSAKNKRKTHPSRATFLNSPSNHN